MRRRRALAAVALAVTTATAAAACSSGSSSSSPTAATSANSSSSASTTAKVTLTWWNNATNQPLLGIYQAAIKGFEAKNPNVTITNVPVQNELLQDTKIPLALEGNNPPNIYQQWGGGVLGQQVTSGKVANITADVSSWIGGVSGANGWQANGQQYGVPVDLHVVGFWYRKDIFSRSASPCHHPRPARVRLTPSSARQATRRSRSAARTAGRTRSGRSTSRCATARSRPFNRPSRARASAPPASPRRAPAWRRSSRPTRSRPASSAPRPSRRGQLGQHGRVRQGRDGAPGRLGPVGHGGRLHQQGPELRARLVPLPADAGHGRSQTAVLGGGDGFSCTGSTAQVQACADFLEYLDSPSVQAQIVGPGQTGEPVITSESSAITLPATQTAAAYFKTASYEELYFDTALPTKPGQNLDTAIANYFSSPTSSTAAAIANSPQTP